MKRILSGSIAAAMFLLSSLSGGVKTEETFHYVKLSQVACSFDGDGNTPLAITVETSPAAYEITPGDTWVKAEKSEEDNTLILTVADNDTGAERSTVIIVGRKRLPGNHRTAAHPRQPDCTLPQTGYVLVNGRCHVAQRQIRGRVLRASRRKPHVVLHAHHHRHGNRREA